MVRAKRQLMEGRACASGRCWKAHPCLVEEAEPAMGQVELSGCGVVMCHGGAWAVVMC